MKLFGGYSGARTQRGGGVRTKASKKKNPFKILAVLLALVLIVEGCYFFVVFTNNKTISNLRTIYIETAMDTLNHKWLATAIFPPSMIDEVMLNRANALAAMEGKESQWGTPVEEEIIPEEPELPEVPEEEPQTEEIDLTVIPEEDPQVAAREAFYELFHELEWMGKHLHQ